MVADPTSPTPHLDQGVAPDHDAPMAETLKSRTPLPPIPDGGLASAMPDWLRPSRSGVASDPTPPPSGGISPDFSTILSDDDLPEWLRRFGDRSPRSFNDAAPTPLPEPATVDDDASLEPAPHRRIRVGSISAPAATSIPLRSPSTPDNDPDRRRVPLWAIATILVLVALAVIALVFR